MHIALKYEHLLEVYCQPPGSAGVQVADRWVESSGDCGDKYLALQHRISVIEHRVH
jgi:hypothetical protein